MSASEPRNSFGARAGLDTASGPVTYYRLDKLAEDGVAEVAGLPFSIKVLLESVLRSENGKEIIEDDVVHLAKYNPKAPARVEVPFKPARVLMQDFTGVPSVVDLAAMRSAMHRLGRDPQRINPELPVDLVIDHSVQVDVYNSPEALEKNAAMEFERNRERYEFLRWGQKAFANFRVVPPANGICHQVNLEYMGKIVCRRKANHEDLAFCDSVLGMDSHTPMIAGLGVLGWGVGGIEAEAVMLGQPYFMLMPQVVGFRLTGSLPPGSTATDLVLTVTEILRTTGVVGKFVEFFGKGLASMTLPDRATLSNMSPEFGARCAFFPVDEQTLRYLRATGRSDAEADLVERYCKAQGLFRTDDTPDPGFAEVLELDLSTVGPCLAGPKRPQDRIPLDRMKQRWARDLRAPVDRRGFGLGEDRARAEAAFDYPDGKPGRLTHGDVVIAAITSCTNTSNPKVMIGAGLLAKKAVDAGLRAKPHVKTSLAPGSKVVTRYLDQAGLTPYLEKLGFHTVGYGCTTCIGNSGPLPGHIAGAIDEGGLVAASVLSGNRNFEGRIHPHTAANYLASPLLVVAYALAGTVDIDLTAEPLGVGRAGQNVFLADIWPTDEEIAAHLDKATDPDLYKREYAGIETANETWNAVPVSGEAIYDWKEQSTYIQEPPFFTDMKPEPDPIAPIENARVLLMLGDSVTTDHISPAGPIAADSPAGRHLIERGVAPEDFNSYGSRRGNDRVMTRGTFGNIRIRNLLVQGTEGGWTVHVPTGRTLTVYEASLLYKEEKIPTIVLAGIDYGMGSSRDWAAKGARLLGVRAVIARSFESIHRSNLIGMGVLPLQFKQGQSAGSLGLTGKEAYTIGVDDGLRPGQDVPVRIDDAAGGSREIVVVCRIDTPIEIEYYRNAGILQTVLRRILKGNARTTEDET